MTALHFEARTHRLRVEGGCRAADRDAILEALDRFAHLANGHLIVDLTAVTEIDQVAADQLVSAVHRTRAEGGTVALVRKNGTPVNDAITAAEARLRST